MHFCKALFWKLLWIKASAKCVNVNESVNWISVSFKMLFKIKWYVLYCTPSIVIRIELWAECIVTPLQPTQPGTQPTQPVTQPTQPGTQPSQPGTQPSQAGTQPTQAGIQNTTWNTAYTTRNPEHNLEHRRLDAWSLLLTPSQTDQLETEDNPNPGSCALLLLYIVPEVLTPLPSPTLWHDLKT